jgi:glycosyltransferase involved in cell wall biosynthesis
MNLGSRRGGVTLATVRGVGNHHLEITDAERFGTFDRIKFIAGDLNFQDWKSIGISRVELIRLRIRPFFYIDPIKIRYGHYDLHSWAYLTDLEKYLDDADLINTGELSPFYSRQCANLARKLKKPLVTTVLETLPGHITTWVPPYSLNTKYVANRTDLFVALWEKCKKYVLSLGVDEEKIRVIPQGLDLQIFHPPREGKVGSKLRILFVGWLVERKGLRELLAAFAHLCSIYGQSIELWIRGNGSLAELVEAYAKRYPIKMFPRIPWFELANLYRECDIFCFPVKPRYELGIMIQEDQPAFSLLEAMASGLPIVSSNIGAIPEAVGYQNLLVTPGSVKELIEALSLLIEDKSLRDRLGRSNRRRAEELYDGHTQWIKYEKAMMDLL